MIAPSILVNGRRVDINNPQPEDFDAVAVATQLGRIPRYLGATKRHYSVLEHSILGCELVLDAKPFGAYTRTIARAFLLHDAHEVITGDIVEPLAVHVPGLRELLAPIKTKIDKAIEQAFDVRLSGEPFVAMIKEVDNVMLQAEWIDLMPTPWYGDNWFSVFRFKPKPIDPHHPHATQAQMVGQFQHLLRVTA
jgi:hypothetical protein